ncbi:hypothetical protein AGMMS49944_06640 [Spirochaetia bacterium]|nr:hypothetical protein AGMMS49944_06640 [Spirochaetia bacterium]
MYLLEKSEKREDLADIYAQLTPENRACLAACTRLCRIAENAAKKEFDRGHTPGFEAEYSLPGKKGNH